MRFHITCGGGLAGAPYLEETIGDIVEIPGMPSGACAVHAVVSAVPTSPLYAVSHIESGQRIAAGETIDLAIRLACERIAKIAPARRAAGTEKAIALRRQVEQALASPNPLPLPEKQLPAVQPPLWMIHVEGPDEITAAPTKKEADRVAAAINSFHDAYAAKRRTEIAADGGNPEHFPETHAVVQKWDGTLEDYATSLSESWDGFLEYVDFVEARSLRETSVASRVDAEALIRECVPGGSICDPQDVADAIRAYVSTRATLTRMLSISTSSGAR